LTNAPAGAQINPTNGLFSWTPSENQGGTNYWITICVTDSGFPALTDTKSFQVTVEETNSPPVLTVTNAVTITEGIAFSLQVLATDPDEPAQQLVFSLTNAPAGAQINPTNGLFSWTPSEMQGGGTYKFTIRATDDGRPPLTASQMIRISVLKDNQAPVLATIPDQTATEGIPLTLVLNATDADVPLQTLAYSLDTNAPVGAHLSSDGVFSWTPSESQGGTNYGITVRVTDSGVPALSDTKTFQVTVEQSNRPPVLTLTNAATITERVTFSLPVLASDPNRPAQRILFSLTNAPAGAQINPTNGLFSWTPAETQGGGTYDITVLATDDGEPPLASSQSICISVLEDNQPPVFLTSSNQVVLPRLPLTFDLMAVDDDLPAQTLTYQFEGTPPLGASLSPAGRFSWTPSDDQAETTNQITVRVTDSGAPPASATNSFLIVVGCPPKFDGGTARIEGDQISLVFQTSPGITYQIQYKDRLSDTLWSNLDDPQTAAGATLTISDQMLAQPTRFYRVIVVE
jgi:hypothetical protein